MEAPKPYREMRPWGEFVKFTENTASTVKIITVNPGQSLSLQHHHSRDEFWRIISGEGTVEIGLSGPIPAIVGHDYFCPRETNHRISADREPLIILEISFGDFDEKDIGRVEDRYGRV